MTRPKKDIIIDIGFEVKQEHVQSANPLIRDQSILLWVSNCRRMPRNLLDPVDIRLHKAINDGKHIACLFAFNTDEPIFNLHVAFTTKLY